MKLVVEGDVRVVWTGDDPEEQGVMVFEGPEETSNLAAAIEEVFGYGQEMNPRDYGPLRITIERI